MTLIEGKFDSSVGLPCDLWKIRSEVYMLRESQNLSIDECEKIIANRQRTYEDGYDMFEHIDKKYVKIQRN